ncbi:hypothetical protein EYR40_002825 [Pleurotus pulmonarius]|nr:hypothetical protein EYR40_002825 [Pleurotus pulmonarius]KAF4582325.1 hypothetical protein EYR38_002443 [Pleurotus pulmonarius]
MESPTTITTTQHNDNHESTDAPHVFPVGSDVVSQNGDFFMKMADGSLIPLPVLTPSGIDTAAHAMFQESSAVEERKKQESGDQEMVIGLQSRSSASEDPAAISTVIGAYDSLKTGVWNVLVPVNPVQVAPPSVAACLTMFDMDARDKNLRVEVKTMDTRSNQFVLKMGTWGNRILYNVGASYMWTTSSQQTQTGTFSWNSQMHTSVFVPWNEPFHEEPKLFVGIQKIDVGDNWRCKVQVEFVSDRGFRFNIHAWGSSDLYNCRLQWIASTDPRIHIGQFEGTSARINLTMSDRPQIMLGMTNMDLKSAPTNARVRMFTENVTNSGFDIKVTKWADSDIYAMAGSYLVYM